MNMNEKMDASLTEAVEELIASIAVVGETDGVLGE